MDLEQDKINRLLNWYRGIPQGPFKIDIELHRRCNLNCISCSRRADDKYEHINEFSKTIEMPKEKWLSIIREAALLGVKEWHIAGGGDPPFFPQLTFPVLHEIKKQGMFGILTTNGTNLSEEQLQTFVKIGWERIHFSIDGPNNKIHDYLRGFNGAFKKTVNTIKLLNEIKMKNSSDKPMINMNTVLSTKNYKLLPKMVKLAKKLRVKYMFVEPLIVYSRTGAQLKLKSQQLKEFQPYLKKAIKLAQRYKINSNFSNFDRNLEIELIEKSSSMHEVVKKDMDKYDIPFFSVPCYDPWFHMTIKADGRVISCDIATDEGDSIKNKTLQEIWLGSYFEKHRRLMLEKNIPDFCRQCNPSHTTQRRRLRAEIEKIKKHE